VDLTTQCDWWVRSITTLMSSLNTNTNDTAQTREANSNQPYKRSHVHDIGSFWPVLAYWLYVYISMSILKPVDRLRVRLNIILLDGKYNVPTIPKGSLLEIDLVI